MLDLIWPYLLISFRVVTIFPLMLAMAFVMGRRAIGELPVFDFLIILSLGSVVGADIANPEIEHLPTAYAIVLIALLQRTVAVATVRFRGFGRLVSFEPIIIVYKGVIQFKNLRKVRYSVDNILQMLREQAVFDMAKVHLAVLESNGKLSLILHPEEAPATVSQLGLPIEAAAVAYPVIMEGRLQLPVMTWLKLDERWIEEQLRQAGVRLEQIFVATVNENKQLQVSLYNEPRQSGLPPVLH